MGTVYLVQSPRLDRVDALKVLTHDLSTDAGFRARFEQEARLASRLAHPNIVRVYDRDSTDGQLWIHMEYVDGIDCSQALRAGPLDPRRALHVIDKVASALDFAHRRGLLHRDVKPANVLLAPGDQPSDPEQVFLTDFGVAKAEGEDTLLTTVGVRLYTPDYAAPEQILGRTTDRRIDIYSLGCVLYELLTGEVPFPLRYREATLEAHVHADRPRPSARVPSLPAAVDYVVARAMAVNPADRYATCSAFARAAQAALFPPQPHHRTQPLPLPLRQNTTVAVRPHGIEPPIRDRPTRSDSGRPAPRRRARRIASRAVTALVVAATTAAALTLPADSYLSAASGALDLPRSAALPDEAMVAVLDGRRKRRPVPRGHRDTRNCAPAHQQSRRRPGAVHLTGPAEHHLRTGQRRAAPFAGDGRERSGRPRTLRAADGRLHNREPAGLDPSRRQHSRDRLLRRRDTTEPAHHPNQR